MNRTLPLLLIASLLFPNHAVAQEKIPILFDFDIGEDIDDSFALATILASPELEMRGVTTVGHDPVKRAHMASRFLTAVGHGKKDFVSAGLPEKSKPLDYWQVQYGNHASVYFRDPKPAKERAPEFLYKHLKANPKELTIVAVGPLTNIGKLLTDHPDAAGLIKRIVIMGGSVYRGYNEGSQPQPEWNILSDPKAAQVVFRAGVPLVIAPLDATAMVKLDAKRQKKLFDHGSLLTLSVQALVQLWQEKNDPILYDPVAVTLVHTEKFCTMKDLALDVDDKGLTYISKQKEPNCRVATAIKSDEFLDWLVERLIKAQPPSWPTMRFINESKMVPRGNMPRRVHVFEDFETDIEKRWWLSGRLETNNVPSGKRAIRGVLTQDFDDRQGETKTLYTAVVFNPVPGPPMGKKTHLSFRYYLKGTDTLRVQLYSLSNGYHRCLMVKGLPEGKWMEGNVDMTQMRKPDGTGGALSEKDFERIDDIQFYADPRAELLIDDIVLYDAAVEGETRPFPQRFLFSGWFDSGKQGVNWPGSFEIAQKLGYFWNAAKSIAAPPSPITGKEQWINVGLRGDRPVGDATSLSFRYKLEGADAMRVALDSPQFAEPITMELKGLKKGDWAEATIDWATAKLQLRKGDSVRAVNFFLPATAQLLVDDVLLYEPAMAGKK